MPIKKLARVNITRLIQECRTEPITTRMSKQMKVGVVATLLLLAVTLGAAALFLNAGQYQAFAGGVQAFAVAVALVIAAATLAADRIDRKVDRVLRLQEELLDSDLYGVRLRLVRHLRKHAIDGKACRVSLSELSSDPQLSKYDDADSAFDPRRDASRLLRYFEKANAARRGGVVAVPLFHELIGRQATWEVLALGKDPGEPSLAPLTELADWANYYAENYRGARPTYIERWGEARRADFGVIYRTPNDTGNRFRRDKHASCLGRLRKTRR